MAEKEENRNKSDSALREEAILKFWQENNVFQKSLEKDSPQGEFVFYDGPPFATGLPHYGHILGSTAKDVFGRYKTMRGYHVPRRWGWDCHGLPIENIVEKDLSLSGHKEIENLGIEKFVEHARSKVLTYVHEWKKTVERIGRWVDFDNSYKTMDNSFIESVWWSFGELYKKGLIYEGVRVLAYCPRCETPIANSEIAMDNSHKDIADISVYVKFLLEGEKNTYLLAWTTTPWTLPGNTAIAINKNLKYIKVKYNEEFYIVVEDRIKSISILKDLELKEGENFTYIDSSEILGKKYIPPFNYYKNADMPNKENIWKVWHADFVTTEKGTGIAHQAPAFGEEDFVLAKENNVPFIIHVNNTGKFVEQVSDMAGLPVKPKDTEEDKDAHMRTDIEVIKKLQENGAYFAKEKIVHSYPHCYRCETPLLYYALPSWFVNIQKVKKDILKDSEAMNWVPEHLKEGRFKNTMEFAPDWTISRNRYWASPLPIWKSASGKVIDVSSVEDLKNKTKKSGNNYLIMRHGQGEHNVLDVCSSEPDYPHHLTEQGIKNVKATAEVLKDKKIDLIIRSPFVRTKETANLVAEIINFPKENIIEDERIREFKFGIFHLKNFKEYVEYRKGHEYDMDFMIPEGESLQQAKNRFADFMYDIENKYQNKNILIVTHGIGFQVLPSILTGGDKEHSAAYIHENFRKIADAALEKVDFVPLPHNANYELDLHRPYIDEISLVDESGEKYERIKEVMDCWFESGSMPFAQDHYPFERPNWQKENFPADFVAEYIAQTRTWYYYTTVLSSVLFGQAPFKNIVTTGTLLAEDGEKMSKSKNNFPDPWILFDKYGVDALRFYLMSGTLMKGDDSNFSEKSVQEISSKIIGRLWNVLSFYELYRDKNLETENKKSENVLDMWIMGRFWEVHESFTGFIEKYYVAEAAASISDFVDDLSTWYLRRSRDRIKDGDQDAKRTLYFVLKNFSKLLAPITPFITEEMWRSLRNENEAESVHLSEWLESTKEEVNYEIIETMQKTRNIVSLGLKERQKAGLAVRQPLSVLKVKSEKLPSEYLELIKDEMNIKEVVFDEKIENEVELNTEINPELKTEGDYRELVRSIQDLRKEKGLVPSDVINLSLANEYKELVSKFELDLKKVVLAENISFHAEGEKIRIEK